MARRVVYGKSCQLIISCRSVQSNAYLQGRAGYGATTEGMWPYSYDTCDLGTFPNQTAANGTPAAAATGSPGGGPLSFLPGQRLSACTCPGSDHPGPSVSDGRGVPEIDILEAQVDVSVFRGQVSQSFQCAPYNYQYEFNNATPATTIYDSTLTSFNSYKGGVFQQAVSAVSYVDSANYNDAGYAAYGYEWFFDKKQRQNGYITWYSGGAETWTITSATIGADPISQVSDRLIPEEPMVRVLLGFSSGQCLTSTLVSGSESRHISRVSKARLETSTISFKDVCRLHSGLSTARNKERYHL